MSIITIQKVFQYALFDQTGALRMKLVPNDVLITCDGGKCLATIVPLREFLLLTCMLCDQLKQFILMTSMLPKQTTRPYFALFLPLSIAWKEEGQ